jgi:hypothetical protein
LRIRPSLLIKQARETVIWRSIVWLAGWTVGGFIFGMTASSTVDSVDSVVFGTIAGLLVGIGLWIVVGAVRALGAPIDPTETVSPRQLLHVDRAAAMRQALTCGLGGMIVLWSPIWLAFDGVFHQPFGAALGHVLPILIPVTVAAGASFWVLLYTAWGRWLVATSWLRLHGRLPSSLMEFLEDAHRRGVLRQSGGVYQFRHARLQARLAVANTESTTSVVLPPADRVRVLSASDEP